MGWFWEDETLTVARTPSPRSPPSSPSNNSPPPGCPMHKSSTAEALMPKPKSKAQRISTTEGASACPYVPPAETPGTAQKPSSARVIRALNPLNYMPSDLSQSPESSSQNIVLPTEREVSSIPRGSTDTDTGNWVYPSPQQMYNAMLRKGHTDAPQDAVESMVAVHNFLNEGAWAEIVEWERRFGKGLMRGWKESRKGEEGSQAGAMILQARGDEVEQPKLTRFMGRSDDMTPKAAILQVMGWMYPTKYATEPPFDRHDWFIERDTPRGTKEVRYVIDYYSAPPEETGEPVFYLDIRPALDRPAAAAERLIRWGRDVWWTASGAAARELLPK